MTNHQCDKCQKALDLKEIIKVSRGSFSIGVELCVNCAEPILEILRNSEFYEKSGRDKLIKELSGLSSS